MKNVLQLITVMFCLQSFSQEIVMEKGKYFVNGSQISSSETQKLLATDFEATSLFESAKSKGEIGGFLLGAGISLTAIDLARGLFSDVKYPTAMTYVGLATTIISIPILSGRKKKFSAAIESYNHSIKQTGSVNFKTEYQILASGNGLGIQIKF